MSTFTVLVSFKATRTILVIRMTIISAAPSRLPKPTAAAGDPPTSIAVRFRFSTLTISVMTGDRESAVRVDTILTPMSPIPTVTPALMALEGFSPKINPMMHIRIGTNT